MIEMTPAKESVFMSTVLEGIEMIRNGRSVEYVRMRMERDPMVSFSPFSVDEVMEEVIFWAGKPKG
jgi:hypothetical protein